MNIAIRVDASIHIGSGHVMRCLVLAQGLICQGHTVTFICRPQPGDMIGFLQDNNQNVLCLPELESAVTPKNTSDYAAWLQVPWLRDAQDVEALIRDADLVVVDHYGLNIEWETRIRSKLNCKIFAVDDLVRSHDADLILDQTLLRQACEYMHSSYNAHILTGCDYALIKPSFSVFRVAALAKKINTEKPKILLTMGAVDQFNVTLNILNVIAAELIECEKPHVTVLLSRQSPHYERVAYFCCQHDWVTHIDFVNDMPDLMHKHELAIGAPGSTTWERACLGIPSILIPLAENQQTICQNMLAADAAISLSIDDIDSHFLAVYNKLRKKAGEYQIRSFNLCDGLGLSRVLFAVEQLCKNLVPIELRKAREDDIDLVYKWQCQPGTRKYAFNSKIPTLQDHQQWMRTKLTAINDYFYIINLGKEQLPVGVIRLDKTQNDSYLVSIFIDERFYGQGIAKRALLGLNIVHAKVKLEAQVLSENIASQRLFTSVGYHQYSHELFIRYPLSS